jgi:hypothetical protein
MNFKIPSTRLLAIGLFITTLAGIGCGGGGGDGDSGNYTGLWRHGMQLVVNDCQLSNAEQSISGEFTVAQDGNNVVVNMGSLTLSGEKNDKDGFAVGTRTEAAGCAVVLALGLTNASDGNADAVRAIAIQCRTNGPVCTVGHTGSATRSGKSVFNSTDLSLEDELTSLLGSSGKSRIGGEPLPENKSLNEYAEEVLEQMIQE